MVDYAFTLKFTEKAKAKCVPSDYDSVIEAWKKKGIKIEVIKFEPDSKGVCHAHGILSVKKGFYFSKLKQVGLHYKIDPITDRQGWINYINKNQTNKPKSIKLFTLRSETSASCGPEESPAPEVNACEPEGSDDEGPLDDTHYVIRKLKRPIFSYNI